MVHVSKTTFHCTLLHPLALTFLLLSVLRYTRTFGLGGVLLMKISLRTEHSVSSQHFPHLTSLHRLLSTEKRSRSDQNIIVAGSVLGSKTSPALGGNFLLWSSAQISSVLYERVHLPGLYCGMQTPPLGKLIDVFFPLSATFVAPSSIMKASQ